MTRWRKILEFPGLGGPGRAAEPQHAVRVQTESLFSDYPGGVFILNEDGRLVVANSAAAPIVALLDAENLDTEAAEKLRHAIGRASRGDVYFGRIVCQRQDDPHGGSRTFDLTLMPGGPVILGLFQEATLERNLMTALKASRELFRDLVSCSSDFAWETDIAGAFTYVSRSGAASYTAQDLIGRQAANLMYLSDDEEAMPTACPFLARDIVTEAEAWLTGADGAQLCFLVSAMPIFDEAGHWRGARGTARDVTEIRARERELAQARSLEALSHAIITSVLSERDPSRMLLAATDALRKAVGASSCWFLERELGRGDSTPRWRIAAVSGADEEALDLPPFLLRAAEDAAEDLEEPRRLINEAGHGVVLGIGRQGAALGVVALLCDSPAAPDRDAVSLIRAIAGHLSVAFSQALLVRELQESSHSDPLSGLLNRRGFLNQAHRRLEQHRRMGRQASLFYLDLDDFKGINDRYGHAKGDATIHMVGEVLSAMTRAGDLVVRFGGDEFGVFFEEADIGHLTRKAEQISNAIRDGARALGIEGGTGVSIGAATFARGSTESLEDLIAKADRALYAAKAAGKKCYRIAEEPEAA
ncbi:MAG: diguanylate cyclase [Alphaproteobacteria bacterium]|nr:diguanylate cyclase [Alphaproteobacteria bacterium]